MQLKPDVTDDRPSIVELQRLCQDDATNHDADLALAAPVLLEIVAAALAWAETSSCDPGDPADLALLNVITKVRP